MARKKKGKEEQPENIDPLNQLEENFPENQITDEEELKQESQKQFLTRIGQKNKDFLIELSKFEKERIVRHIKNLVDDALPKHQELEDRLDEYDEVYRMERKEIQESDGDLPNYRTPLTTSAIEVVHANYMNVFFTPKDIMNVLPTEKGDIPKVQKLTTFSNWSMKNEMDIFNNIDRLFHASAKNGEAPYIIHWVKEYGVDIKRRPIPDPRDPSRNLVDPDTQETLFIETEENKLLYNGPKMEIFSRKDYIQPKNAIWGKTPPWEARYIRMTFDKYLRETLKKKIYKGSLDQITDWGSEDSTESNKVDTQDDVIPVGKWEKRFVEIYLRMRIKEATRDRDTQEVIEEKELEDEFIAVFNREDEVLCSLRKNKFPLKLRPIGIDYFMPDDEIRRSGTGMVKFMESQQKGYDSLFNQYLFGVIQANNPMVFFEPLGNTRDEAFKIRAGYAYPTSNAGSMKLFQFPSPTDSIQKMLDIIRFWAQMLFGISDFQAGLESTIDPDAPAKKAQIVVAQGNVRLNAIIKRKNRTLKDIFKRWFLLYQENMPPNKFMRIAGEDKDPWKFQPVNLEDFALKSIPDFELTGNILNSNKAFQAQKALAIYNVFIQNPFFAPNTAQGLRSLHQLTKWLSDQMDETGISSFLPPTQGEFVQTPQEENARFLQGDKGEPSPEEDHVSHIREHGKFINDPSVPEDVRLNVGQHIAIHVKFLQQQVTQQMVLGGMGFNEQEIGQINQGQQAPGGQNVRSAQTTGRPGAGVQF